MILYTRAQQDFVLIDNCPFTNKLARLENWADIRLFGKGHLLGSMGPWLPIKLLTKIVPWISIGVPNNNNCLQLPIETSFGLPDQSNVYLVP